MFGSFGTGNSGRRLGIRETSVTLLLISRAEASSPETKVREATTIEATTNFDSTVVNPWVTSGGNHRGLCVCGQRFIEAKERFEMLLRRPYQIACRLYDSA